MTVGTMEVLGRERFLRNRLIGWKGNVLDFTTAIAIGMHYDEVARQEKEKAGLKTDKEKENERMQLERK